MIKEKKVFIMQTFVLGLFFTLVLFFACLFLVAGVKATYLLLKYKLNNIFSFQILPEVVEKPKRKYKRKKKSKSSNQVVRSIEINPEEVDRIYVKKSV